MSESGSSSGSGCTLLAFACVYFFWGSTYAAIHVAGLGLAPPLVAGCRSVLSTAIICGICLVRGTNLRVTRGEAWRLALVGLLMMTVNNVLLTWAETMVASGLASLVIATIPIMVAVIQTSLPGGEGLNKRGWAGTMLGTGGMVALVWPSLRGHGGPAGRQMFAFGVLLVAALAFAVASILSQRFRFRLDSFVVTAWEIGCAGVVNLVIAVLGGTLRTAHWSWRGVEAIAYLSVFGSVIGLSAYSYLLQHVPVTKVSTYAFVNPMIAVLLGVVLLHERLLPTEAVGMGIIVAAVAMVVLSRVKRTPVGEPLVEAAERYRPLAR